MAWLNTTKLIEGPCEHLLPFVEHQRRRLHTLMCQQDCGIYTWHGEIDGVTIALRAWQNGGFQGATVRMTGGFKLDVLNALPDPVPYRNLFIRHGNFDFPYLTVVLSDGTELARVAQTPLLFLGISGYGYTMTPITLDDGLWPGGNFVPLYDAEVSHIPIVVDTLILTPRAPLVWDTPLDVSLVSSTTTPPALEFLDPSGIMFNEPELYPAYVVAFNESRAQGLEREKMRLRKNSAKAIDGLRALTWPRDAQGRQATYSYLWTAYYGWTGIVASAKRASRLPRQLKPPTVTLISDTAVGNVIGGTRSVKFSYLDANGESVEETITGTKSITRTVYGDFDWVNTITYDNYPAFIVDSRLEDVGILLAADEQLGPETLGPVSDAYLRPFAQILNGTVVDSSFLRDSTYGYYPADTAYYNLGYLPFPYRSSTVTGATAPIFLRYLREVPPVSVDSLPDPKPPYARPWLAARMTPGEGVTLVLFGMVKDEEDLGMFAATSPVGVVVVAQKIAVYGVASLRYNEDGSFTVQSWRDAVPAADGLDAGPKIVRLEDSQGMIPWSTSVDWGYMNCLIEYSSFAWKDQKIWAAQQAKQLKAPERDEERFIRLIKTAIGL